MNVVSAENKDLRVNYLVQTFDDLIKFFRRNGANPLTEPLHRKGSDLADLDP